MNKYIVEAPELKDGQNASTGGIRENGKLTALFANPVPYEEQTTATATVQPPDTLKDVIADRTIGLAADIGYDLVSMLWFDLCRPFIQSRFKLFLQKKACAPKNMEASNNITDIHASEIAKTDTEEDKIINFRC